MTELVRLDRRGGVAVVTLESPPVNALGAGLREAVLGRLDDVARDPAVDAVVLAGAGRGFSAGADIREFSRPVAGAPGLRDVIQRIEEGAKPVVAAIHGMALGGGLELALGCHARVAAPGARLGLPEIKLGIFPGAGGTQRLPRLIGVGSALDMMLSGDPVDPEAGRESGLIDAVIEGDLVDGAVAFAEQLVAAGEPPRRTREIETGLEAARADPAVFQRTREAIARKTRGLIAPECCIRSVENALTMAFDEALAEERALFLRCRDSAQSKAQRHVFFAERAAAKVPDVPADTPAAPIATAAVIGCGTMGGGIAMNFANAGIPVRVVETAADVLENGLAVIRRNYAGSVKRGRITQAQMDARLALIEGTCDFAEIADADIVIEAVFEDMAVKQAVFATLDRVCKAGAVLATNTSTLDVDAIAAATARPESVIGTHFFSPANVMKLMENVRGAKTSKEVIATVMRLSKALGKVGVLVGICDGFVGNRMLYAYSRQSNFLLEEGALPHQVDTAITDFGFPMGPFAMGDLAGLDVSWRIRRRRAATRPKDQRYSPIADRICEQGRFGQKTGAGWYRYEAGSRTPIPDPEIEALIVAVSEELGIARREITEQEILERCLYPLINEGAKLLEEGIALRPGDIDVIWIYGYGFPLYRGGPMYYADRVGLKAIYDAMSRLYDTHGDMLEPAPLLRRLADQGKGFHDG